MSLVPHKSRGVALSSWELARRGRSHLKIGSAVEDTNARGPRRHAASRLAKIRRRQQRQDLIAGARDDFLAICRRLDGRRGARPRRGGAGRASARRPSRRWCRHNTLLGRRRRRRTGHWRRRRRPRRGSGGSGGRRRASATALSRRFASRQPDLDSSALLGLLHQVRHSLVSSWPHGQQQPNSSGGGSGDDSCCRQPGLPRAVDKHGVRPRRSTGCASVEKPPRSWCSSTRATMMEKEQALNELQRSREA